MQGKLSRWLLTVLSISMGLVILAGGVATPANHEMMVKASDVESVRQSQFNSDVTAVREAARMSSSWVRKNLSIGNINAIRDNGVNAYEPGDIQTDTFDSVFAVYSNSLDAEGSRTDFNQDRQGIMALYQHFQGFFSTQDNATLQGDLAMVASDDDWEDKATDLASFADDLSGAFENYTQDIARLVDDITPVAAVPVTPDPVVKATVRKITSQSIYHRNGRKIKFANGVKGAKLTLKNQKRQVVKKVTVTKNGSFTVKLTKAQAKKLARGGKHFTYTVTRGHRAAYTGQYTIR